MEGVEDEGVEDEGVEDEGVVDERVVEGGGGTSALSVSADCRNLLTFRKYYYFQNY